MSLAKAHVILDYLVLGCSAIAGFSGNASLAAAGIAVYLIGTIGKSNA